MSTFPDAVCIHVPAGEVPSRDGHWSITRFNPFAPDPVMRDKVEVWDGLDEPFRVPNGELMLFLMQMKKKYGNG